MRCPIPHCWAVQCTFFRLVLLEQAMLAKASCGGRAEEPSLI